MLFVCDNVFVRDGENIYSNSFSYSILKRYRDIFGKVTVVGRVEDKHSVDNISLASGGGMEFIFLDSISNIGSFFGKRREYHKLLSSIIDDYDGVIVRLPSEFGLLVSSIAKEKNIPYLAEIVGCGWEAMWYYGGVKSKLYALVLFLKMRLAVANASSVSYVTEEFLQKRYPSKKKTISLSDVYIPYVDNQVLEKRVNKIKSQKKITIGTIAFLDVDYKGLDTAIKAISLLDYEIEYRILGEGNSQRYQTMAKNLEIKFEKSLPQGERVFEWLDYIDIYLQPSLTEAMPRSLIEAMSRGCVCIASSVGEIPKLLDNKMLHKAKDIQKLSQLIGKIINDKKLQIEQASLNFNKAQNYNSDILDKKRDEFYRGYLDLRENLS
ncbi:MAG: glycosyltransferase [Sulfurovum sp.]